MLWQPFLRCSRLSYHSPLITRLSFSTYSHQDYTRLILESKVYDVSACTALQPAVQFSAALNNSVLFKREDMQPVFSFKIRGAYNKMANLSPQEKEAGTVCCSAGNHAQGVALAAKHLGIQAKIVMPVATPEIKIKSVIAHGQEFAQVILHGQNYDEAAAEARRLEKEENCTMIAPFDDPLVIAGQGTMGMEILQQTAGQNLDAIFVCCGGGGMLAGIATWVKYFRPDVKVIGVEAVDAAGMTHSLAQGKPTELATVGLFADGAAVKFVGRETYRLCAEHVDEMITVSTDDICAAIKTAFYDTRVLLEPAGALAIAGIQKYVQTSGVTGQTFVATLSGANTDFNRLRYISERADRNEKLISVKIEETPGTFHQLYSIFEQAGARVTEFSYRYSNLSPQAHIYMSYRTFSKAQDASIRLSLAPFSVLDLTDNELAKLHSRHMAGGGLADVPNGSREHTELIYRFEFRNGPGALNAFLHHIHGGWNISLFHYRNHGSDIERVLVAFQVNTADQHDFQKFLDQLPYSWVDENENPVYHQFLL